MQINPMHALEPAAPEVTIARIIKAPRMRVWKAWTDPQQMAQWWGPKNFTTPICEMDVRPGGLYRFVMRGPDGVDYPIKGVYREVVAPERLVMTMDLSEHPDPWHDLVNPNRDKSMGRPPLNPLCTVSFKEAGSGKTSLAITMSFDTPALRDAMVKMGMEPGWNQSLDRLEALVGSSKPMRV
jgi:uncharacterized protein YndB with AHSA1/START domain